MKVLVYFKSQQGQPDGVKRMTMVSAEGGRYTGETNMEGKRQGRGKWVRTAGSRRDDLRAGRECRASAQAARFLTGGYRTRYFYFELVELLRRLLMCGWVVRIPHDHRFFRLLFTLGVSFFCLSGPPRSGSARACCTHSMLRIVHFCNITPGRPLRPFPRSGEVAPI